MAAFQYTLESLPLATMEEAEELARSMQGKDPMAEWEPATPIARAQKVAYAAWEEAGARRYRLARRALEIDPRCSDAWLILAEEERNWRKRLRCFQRAVEAAERAAREEGWLDGEDGRPGREAEQANGAAPGGGRVSAEEGDDEEGQQEEETGLYRRHVGLRAYVRARVALARYLAGGGYRDQARVRMCYTVSGRGVCRWQ